MAYTKIDVKCPLLKQGVHYLTSDYKTRNKKRKHSGMDFIGKNYACDHIIAIEKGIVATSKYSITAGYYVEVDHGNGYVSRYLHMKKGSILVKKGDKIIKGQVLGYMGNTGASAGAHLHFGMRLNGIDVDPLDFLNGTVNLLEAKSINEFTKGNYKALETMNVRSGAGTKFPNVKVKDLTSDGRKHATSKSLNAKAQYKKGTTFTALEIIDNGKNGIWAKTPSGFICIKGSSGKIYCEKK